MKMLVLGILLLIVGIFLISCGIFHAISSNEVMGQYKYIYAHQYEGPLNREIPIWVSHEFGQADLVEISKAVEQWNFVLNGYVHLTIVDTDFDMETSKVVQSVKQGGWIFQRIDSKNPMVPVPTEPGLWTIGFVEEIGGSHLYLIRDRLGNEDVFGVTMHEIGHLLGAPHVGRKLMSPRFSKFRYQCVDIDTMMAVASYQGVGPDDLNYCVDKESYEMANQTFVTVTKTPSDVTDEVSNCPPELNHP